MSRTVLHSRYVKIVFNLLDHVEAGEVLELNLFENTGYTMLIKKAEELASGQKIWDGTLGEIDSSRALLVTQNELISGIITVPGGIQEVVYSGSGVHRVQEVNQALYQAEAKLVQVELASNTPYPVSPELLADNGSIIRMLVVYTPAARAAAGSATAIQNLINLALAETNQSYANSGI